MKYTCKLCGGRGKQNGLSCTCCKGRRFFDADGEIEGCKVCKGSGRGVIKTLPCIRCGGRGFSISTGITERTLPGPPEERKRKPSPQIREGGARGRLTQESKMPSTSRSGKAPAYPLQGPGLNGQEYAEKTTVAQEKMQMLAVPSSEITEVDNENRQAAPCGPSFALDYAQDLLELLSREGDTPEKVMAISELGSLSSQASRMPPHMPGKIMVALQEIGRKDPQISVRNVANQAQLEWFRRT